MNNKVKGLRISCFQGLAVLGIFAISACSTSPTKPDETVKNSQLESPLTSVEPKNTEAKQTAIKDGDGDGVPNNLDQCQNTPPLVGVNMKGCALDTDGDTVADYRDQCIGTPQGIKIDERGCGLDDDKDGVPNFRDRCAGTSIEVTVDGFGCEWDSDNDGVVDSKDLCIGTPPGVKVESMGCHVIEIITLKGVHFKTGSDELNHNARNMLQSMADNLLQHPKMRVEIAGHTDNTGSDEINKNLSTRRAKSAKMYLIDLGVQKNALSSKGYGSNQPVASNETEKGRSLNRRVELRVVEID